MKRKTCLTFLELSDTSTRKPSFTSWRAWKNNDVTLCWLLQKTRGATCISCVFQLTLKGIILKGPKNRHFANTNTHLSFGCGHSSSARVNLLIDGGEEVLRNPQSVLQQWEVWVVFRSVFQQVLYHEHARYQWKNTLNLSTRYRYDELHWKEPYTCADGFNWASSFSCEWMLKKLERLYLFKIQHHF